MLRKGKLPEAVLRRSVLRLIHRKNSDIQKGPAVGNDCAALLVNQGELCVLSSDPMAGDAGQIGRAAVITALNNLAASGAAPSCVMLSLCLPVDTEEEELRQIIRDADEAALEEGAEIAGGHTEVTDAVTVPVLTVTAVSFRRAAPVTDEKPDEADMNRQEKINRLEKTDLQKKADLPENKNCLAVRDDRPHPGMDIVITKWVGMEATWMLAERRHNELRSRFSEHFLTEAAGMKSLLSVRKEAEIAERCGAEAMRDVSRGGIFGALWEFAERGGIGLDIDLRAIPIRQETVEITEFFGMNPYEILSGGSLLIAARDGHRLVRKLAENGIHAAVAGVTTDKKDRLLRNGEEIRFLDKPQADSLLIL